MKKILSVITVVVAVLGLSKNVWAQEVAAPDNGGKVLIAYYSISGNTEEVAKKVQEEIGGDLFRIETVEVYPEEYKELVAQAKKEINDGFRPQLKNKVENIAQYDTIFIGSPNWWGTIAPAVSAFIESNNLEGKKVIPIITHGSGGVQNTIKDMQAQCKGCNFVEDGWVGFRSRTWGVSGWLEELGLKK